MSLDAYTRDMHILYIYYKLTSRVIRMSHPQTSGKFARGAGPPYTTGVWCVQKDVLYVCSQLWYWELTRRSKHTNISIYHLELSNQPILIRDDPHLKNLLQRCNPFYGYTHTNPATRVWSLLDLAYLPVFSPRSVEQTRRFITSNKSSSPYDLSIPNLRIHKNTKVLLDQSLSLTYPSIPNLSMLIYLRLYLRSSARVLLERL